MSRIRSTFERLRGSRAALIPFLVAGDPSLDFTARACEALVRGGADLIELGVPFSDPIADGPINQRAYQRALAGGVSLRDVLNLVRDVRAGITIPIVLLTYFNPILQFGPERFCAEAVTAGVDGVVIPDLPPDEAGELIRAAKASGLDVIFLLAPTSTDARMKLAATQSSGFVYCVSVTGVTGVRDRLSGEVEGLVKRIRQHTTLPICVGFGVSSADQARQVGALADGVIVGSAVVSLLEDDRSPARLEQFVSSLRAALDGAHAGKAASPRSPSP